jgi:multidrug resistance efflux pump
LLIAPTSGTLNYLSVWSNLQEISAGDAVFSIIPADMGDLHARIILPFRGAGKVRPGQRVNIKLDGYPYMEYGMVVGHVHSVSGGPVDTGFLPLSLSAEEL